MKKIKQVLKTNPILTKIQLGLMSTLLIVLFPMQTFAAKAQPTKPISDIETSVNTGGEGIYNFITNIAYWVGVAMIAIGFLCLKFKWLDRQGKATTIILSVLFAIGGIFAAPAIIDFVIGLVK